MQCRLINMFSVLIRPFIYTILILCFAGQPAFASSENSTLNKMEIFFGGEKVGASKTLIERSDDRVRVEEDSLMDITVMGKRGTIKIDSSYLVRDNSIDNFSYQVVSDSVELDIQGERKEDKIIITSSKGKKRVMDYGKRNYIIPALLPHKLISEGVKEGDDFTVFVFDPVTFYTGGDPDKLKAEIKVGGIEKVSTALGEYNARKVTVNYLGTSSYMWITEKGVKVKEHTPPGFTSFLSNSDNKDKPVSGSFNISEETAITVEKNIANPREVNHIKLRIQGIDLSDGLDIHDGYRQFLSGNELDIKNLKKRDKSSGLPERGEVLKKYLEASNLINPDDKGIIKKSSSITGGEKDNFKKAALINDWVFQNIEKVPLMSIPDSAEVLAGMKGDCNEHAVLFTALARASNIPTKVIMGLVYIDGKFHYHAWNEIYAGKWIAVDPTFGQVPADATHLKLMEGDISRSPEIIKVVGRMRLDVLYYE